MMKRSILPMILTLLLLINFLTWTATYAENVKNYKVLIDLTRTNDFSGINILVRQLYDGEIYILLKDISATSSLDFFTRNFATIFYGSLDNLTDARGSSVKLEDLDIDMIIIPSVSSDARFTQGEIDKLRRFVEEGRAIWISLSTYSRNNIDAIDVINRLLTNLGSGLSLDNVSIKDPVNNVGDPLKMIVYPSPSSDIEFVRYGVDKILMYRPSPVIWRNLSETKYISITKELANVKIITITSSDAEVNEIYPGASSSYYNQSSKGSFVVTAAEILKIRNVSSTIILSGAPLIGGSSPMIIGRYDNTIFNGPIFVRNIVLWATRYMGELSFLNVLNNKIDRSTELLIEQIGNISRDLNVFISNVTNRLDAINTKVSEYDQKINDVKIRSENLSALTALLSDEINSLRSSIDNLRSYVMISVGLSIASLAISLALYILGRRK